MENLKRGIIHVIDGGFRLSPSEHGVSEKFAPVLYAAGFKVDMGVLELPRNQITVEPLVYVSAEQWTVRR